jgi:hypothetical protein
MGFAITSAVVAESVPVVVEKQVMSPMMRLTPRRSSFIGHGRLSRFRVHRSVLAVLRETLTDEYTARGTETYRHLIQREPLGSQGNEFEVVHIIQVSVHRLSH